MIRSGNYIIIPVEISSFVLEVKGDELSLVGESRGQTMETILNEVRRVLVGHATRETENQQGTLRSWKRYKVSKEFMSEVEAKLHEVMWQDFDYDKYLEESNGFLESYNRGLFEVTDLMLEYNIPIHSVSAEKKDPVKEVSLQEVSKMLGNLVNKGDDKDDDKE